ncbi:MAG: hypothetical protein WC806_03605 [Candidatus Gracilibacteria bacterium]|jgi:hypothetical protein
MSKPKHKPAEVVEDDLDDSDDYNPVLDEPLSPDEEVDLNATAERARRRLAWKRANPGQICLEDLE